MAATGRRPCCSNFPTEVRREQLSQLRGRRSALLGAGRGLREMFAIADEDLSGRTTRRPPRCISCASSSCRPCAALRGARHWAPASIMPLSACGRAGAAPRLRAHRMLGRFAPRDTDDAPCSRPAASAGRSPQTDESELHRLRYRSPLRTGARASPPGHVHPHLAAQPPGPRGHRQQRR